MLAPFVDEIELLFFESRAPGSLPDNYEIASLEVLKVQTGVTYNVHLPIDISIVSANPNERKNAVRACNEIISATSSLEPVSYTLHLPYSELPGGIKVWQAYAFKGLKMLLETGINPGIISLETLDYDPSYLSHFAEELGFSLCMDIGHLIIYGYSPKDFYLKNRDRITVIHLHGCSGGSDHQALNVLDEETVEILKPILNDFTGSLSIEVFSFDDLYESVKVLETWMHDETCQTTHEDSDP